MNGIFHSEDVSYVWEENYSCSIDMMLTFVSESMDGATEYEEVGLTKMYSVYSIWVSKYIGVVAVVGEYFMNE